jgi:hypothetical protein
MMTGHAPAEAFNSIVCAIDVRVARFGPAITCFWFCEDALYGSFTLQGLSLPHYYTAMLAPNPVASEDVRNIPVLDVIMKLLHAVLRQNFSYHSRCWFGSRRVL